MTSSDSRKNLARREAEPIAWEQLSQDQQDAIRQAVGILGDLAKPPETTEEGKSTKESHLDLFLPPIDAKRLNHVVLLDGDRGSGKTAVLVTLLDAWNRVLRGREDKLDKDFRELLKATEHVVPIGLIDLQPLPKSTNLLLYLVGRFQRVVEAIEQVHTERGPRARSTTDRRQPWQGVSPEEPASTAKWRDFVHAAALGWNGDIGQRRGSLDPEAFVLELEQTERRRLDIVSSFRKLIDALVEEYPRLDAKPKDNPLFLLAIDDADTNPEKAEELLDLVRTLWHPRVAFLLTGDSKLFLAMLRNRLTKSLGNGQQQFANELAVDIYNKAIPPVHRSIFRRLPPRVRLARMEKHLDRLPYRTVTDAPDAQSNPNLKTLYRLLNADEQLQEALPSLERSLVDLQARVELELKTPLDPESKGVSIEQQATRRVIAALCRAAFGTQNEHVSRYGPEQDLIDAARAVRTWEWRASNRGAFFLDSDPDWKLVVQQHPRWEAIDPQAQSISEAMIAVGMLARDAVARFLPHGEPLPPIKSMGLLGIPVRVEYYYKGEPYSFAWPLPFWPSFVNYFDFGTRWGQQVPKPEDYKKHHIDNLAGRFVRTVVHTLRNTEQPRTDEWSWESLARDVSELAKSENEAASQWARSRAGLLAAPESRLGSVAANQWLDALRSAFGDEWEAVRNALRNERRVRVRVNREPAQEKAVDSILSDIDRNCSEYKWREFIMKREPIQAAAEAEPLTPLLEALKTIATPWWPSRPNLASYFVDLKSRNAAFNAQTSSERLNALMAAVEPYKGREGAAAEAMVKLWQAECRLLGAAADDIEAKDGRIVAPSLDHLESPVTIDRNGARHMRGGAGVVFYRLTCRMTTSPPPKTKPNFQDVLLRGIFDMKVDAADVENASPPPAPCKAPFWPGFGGYANFYGPGYQWPTPGWPTCYDWERLADAWNDAFAHMGRFPSQNEMEQYQPMTDAFMYWLLLSISAIFRGDEVRVPLNLNPDINSFVNDGIDVVAQRPTSPTTARAKAYGEWCDNLLLFSAPESGISGNLAMELLAQIGITGNLENKKTLLRKLRVERARASGVPDDKINRELAAIDRANRNHPWITRVGGLSGTR